MPELTRLVRTINGVPPKTCRLWRMTCSPDSWSVRSVRFSDTLDFEEDREDEPKGSVARVGQTAFVGRRF